MSINFLPHQIANVSGKEHFNVMRDIRELISDKVIDQFNFEEISLPDSYGRMQPAYLLDFNATLTLVLGYDSHRRIAVVKRWRELEQGEAAASLPDFGNPVAAARAWANELEQKQKLLTKVNMDAPKVAYVEEVIEQTEGMMTLSDFGRVLKETKGLDTGARKIFDQLRSLGILMRNKTIPMSRFVDRGYFVIGQKTTKLAAYPVAFVTGKGQLWLHKKLREVLCPEQF